MSEERCDECQFWEPIKSRDYDQEHPKQSYQGSGVCHRYPPRMAGALIPYLEASDPNYEYLELLEAACHFSFVFEDGWCGEYQAKKG